MSRLSELIEDVPDHVLSLRSPGRKKSMSPSLLSGLFGGCDRCAAGMGGTGACKLLRLELLRFVTPGMYAIWIMLLARLRMLAAREPRVRVEAASPMVVKRVDRFVLDISSFIHSSSSSASCSARRFLIQKK